MATAYRNTRLCEPEPESYAAALSVAPVSSSSAGAPATVTASEKFTAMWIVLPVAYVPVRFGDETDTTDGGSVSIAMSVEPLSEFGRPGSGRSRPRAAPLAVEMLPPSRLISAPRS